VTEKLDTSHQKICTTVILVYKIAKSVLGKHGCSNLQCPPCCGGSVSLYITARHRISWCIPVSHKATKPPCSWTRQYAPSIIHDVHLKSIYSPCRRSFILTIASRLSINTPLLSFCESIFLQNLRLVLFFCGAATVHGSWPPHS
jgi:hypothetical protein